MKKEEIIEILLPLNFWGKFQDTGFRRFGYLKKLEEFLKAEGVVISLIGVRRAGKTYLARQLLDLKCKDYSKEATLYVLLEDPKFEPYLNVRLLDDIYEAYRTYIHKELNCRNLLVITEDYEGKENINAETIVYKPLWKLLIEGELYE